jgi:hypothetical protein
MAIFTQSFELELRRTPMIEPLGQFVQVGWLWLVLKSAHCDKEHPKFGKHDIW